MLITLLGVFSLYAATSPQIPKQNAKAKVTKRAAVTTKPTNQTNTAKPADTTKPTDVAKPVSEPSTPKPVSPPLKAYKYPVSEIIPQTLDQVDKKTAVELRNPANIKTVVEYDPATGIYQVVTKLGEEIISTPISLTQEEYLQFQEQQSTAAYWRSKNKIDYSKKKDEFSLTDMQFDIGLGDKVFGEGGVRLKTQGSVETKFGLKTNIVDNPSLSENARNRTRFNFDQNIQMSVNGKVGDKIDVNMNYDTEATFQYDAKSI
ncbi:MAG: hypothetical protein NTY32_05535, partial [Bacteroidia bacterium]|nr:hypothetical protein [Bacteroidia bacterium]